MLGGVVVITAAHGSGFGFRFGVQGSGSGFSCKDYLLIVAGYEAMLT